VRFDSYNPCRRWPPCNEDAVKNVEEGNRIFFFRNSRGREEFFSSTYLNKDNLATVHKDLYSSGELSNQ
jgi:hypothetical protein